MSIVHILGLILSITVLIVLVYRKNNSVFCAIVAAIIAGITNGLHIGEIIDIYSEGITSFMAPILFLFIISAVYGKLMSVTGSADAIAVWISDSLGDKYAILAYILSISVLVYGGISVFTVIFCVYPIGLAIIKKQNIPLELLPCMITIGQSTYAMTAIPGTPQMNNIIPGNFFGTTLNAAPILGIICAIAMLVPSYIYLMKTIERYKRAGIGFDIQDVRASDRELLKSDQSQPVWKAIMPIAALYIGYLLLSQKIIPNDLDMYKTVQYSMLFATAVLILLNLDQLVQIKRGVQDGCKEWINPLINLCVIIGFGSVVKQTPGFQECVSILKGWNLNPYISAAVCTMIVSGITGSASGGVQISCNTFSSLWLSTGNPQVLHRICSIASCSLDSLPHCGGLYSTFSLCNVPFNKGYKHVAVVTVLIPSVVTVLAVVLGSIGIV